MKNQIYANYIFLSFSCYVVAKFKFVLFFQAVYAAVYHAFKHFPFRNSVFCILNTSLQLTVKDESRDF